VARGNLEPSAKAPWTITIFLTGSARVGAAAVDSSVTAAAAAAMDLCGIALSFMIEIVQPEG
jgi:hypothetical protein